MHSHCLPACLPACLMPAAPLALTKSQTQPPQCDETDWLPFPPLKREGAKRRVGVGGWVHFLFWSFHVPPWSCQIGSSAACRGHRGRTIPLLPSPNTRPPPLPHIRRTIPLLPSPNSRPPPAPSHMHSHLQSCQHLKKPWSEILSGVCHTAKPWELDAYLIIYIRWPDVLFSPDMSSFRDLKNASGRDSKNGILPRRIFVFLWVFHKLVITPLQVLERVSPGWIILLRLRLRLATQLHRRTRFGL